MCRIRCKQKSKAHFPSELNIGRRISNHADILGLIIRPIEHLNVMSPPLIMTREEVKFIVVTLRKAIKLTMSDLQKEGLWQG